MDEALVSRRSRQERRLNREMDRILAREGHERKPLISNRSIRKMLSNRLSVFGLAVFLVIVVASFGAPLIAPYSANTIDLTTVLRPPSAEHWLGTDKIGRDVLSRILFGGQISIIVGLGSALGAAIIGVSVGVLAGYLGGLFDKIVFRLSELFMSFPQIILVLLLVSVVGQSLMNLIIIFIVTGWGSLYRMARSQTLSIREEEYVTALKAFGISPPIVCFRHILPNAIGPIVVNITLSTAMFILQESSLSFLGLGVPMEVPTWGNILNVANDLSILREAWWMWLPVGTVISLFVLAVNFIGDGLRDSSDPSQQG